ncbi:ATP-binding protein [Deinococcus sp. SM5_A1]|uniref:ATP-binding protein n=1 Tax=Deinococcus sp. SM5_A1 TaxID=3379094 RepID=UPI00385D1FA7
MQDYEKLGAFYLGKAVDGGTGAVTDELLLYDSADLTTHAVIIGMTGSGKTGLGLGLIEEAAMDGIPVLAVDPKGDLANLLLTFPDLAPADFRPWVDESEATRGGITPDELATQKAAMWQKGLADWGQSGERIRALKEKADFAVYTPGSSAGRPISVLKGFDAPPPEIMDDADALRERIGGTVSGLLGLLGIDADPLRSREHVLLSTLLSHAWAEGRTLDMAGMIAGIQTPPFTQIGVMGVDAFYPPKDRFDLAMSLNNLLASPGFAVWTQGEPLDVGRFLFTPEGKPRVSIMNIAHLNDSERMFFVSMLLNAVLSWMRTQSGTSSLRALLYMDEIAGFFPPNGNPPSKPPMLTLLKQARAFGLGVTLATQNPVDLDYKGLSNTGTWMIGRLQTDNDKARVLEALQGASAGQEAMSRAELDKLLSGLGKRVFLMHNVHDARPTLFTTRWTMSYLAGPITGSQIRKLAQGKVDGGQLMVDGKTAPPLSTINLQPPTAAKPLLPPGVTEVYIPTTETGVTYHPHLLAVANVRYSNLKAKVDVSGTLPLALEVGNGPISVNWADAAELPVNPATLEKSANDDASFAEIPAPLLDAKNYPKWSKEAARYVAASKPLTLWQDPSSGVMSSPGESEGDFRARASHAGREARDAAVQKLRAKYASKVATLQTRLERAQMKVGQQQAQAQQAQLQTAMNVGVGVLGALFGGGRRTTALRSGVSGVGRSMREGQDVQAAQAEWAQVSQQMQDLQNQVQAEVDALSGISGGELERVEIRAKAADVSIPLIALAWLPFVSENGALRAAWAGAEG